MTPTARCAVALVTASSAIAVLPSCTSTANVTEVYTALDAAGLRRRNEFYTDAKEIHCIAEAGIGRDGVTVEGFIRQRQAYDFVENRFVPVDRVLAYAETSPARSAQPIKISVSLTAGATEQTPGGLAAGQTGDDDKPFVAGRYECEIRLDGVVEGTAVFNIDFPPCPPAVILQGTRCFGFYRENDLCPASGESGSPDPKCTCTQAGGWKC